MAYLAACSKNKQNSTTCHHCCHLDSTPVLYSLLLMWNSASHPHRSKSSHITLAQNLLEAPCSLRIKANIFLFLRCSGVSSWHTHKSSGRSFLSSQDYRCMLLKANIFLLAMLGTEARASCMPGKCSTTKLWPALPQQNLQELVVLISSLCVLATLQPPSTPATLVSLLSPRHVDNTSLRLCSSSPRYPAG